jgi:hypothetical protein
MHSPSLKYIAALAAPDAIGPMFSIVRGDEMVESYKDFVV